MCGLLAAKQKELSARPSRCPNFEERAGQGRRASHVAVDYPQECSDSRRNSLHGFQSHELLLPGEDQDSESDEELSGRQYHSELKDAHRALRAHLKTRERQLKTQEREAALASLAATCSRASVDSISGPDGPAAGKGFVSEASSRGFTSGRSEAADMDRHSVATDTESDEGHISHEQKEARFHKQFKKATAKIGRIKRNQAEHETGAEPAGPFSSSDAAEAYKLTLLGKIREQRHLDHVRRLEAKGLA